MTATSANLLDHVIPPAVPLRQWVFTVAYPLRARLAYDGALLSAVGRLFADTVLRWYTRRMEAAGVYGGRSGAVAVVQRASSDLRCNPHWHAIFADGVFVPAADGGRPAFHPLPHLSTTGVAVVLQLARARILRFLAKRGVVEVAEDAFTVTADDAAGDPALAALTAASVSGLPPAGSARRKPLLVPLPGRPGVTISAPLCVSDFGFSLHAASHAGAEDIRARQALVKYALRPPVANQRLETTADGTVRLLLKKPFREGYASHCTSFSLVDTISHSLCSGA